MHVDKAESRAREIAAAGVLAGLLGGLLMALWVLGQAAVAGVDGVGPVRHLGTTFTGERLASGASLAWAISLHAATSLVWGLLFAALAPRTMRWSMAVPAGLAYALGVMLVMTFLVLPVVKAPMRVEVVNWFGFWMLLHALYGLGVSTAPALRRRFGKLDQRLGAGGPSPVAP
jgi:hypothetical protein